MTEQLLLLEGLSKKCRNCRKAKDVKPKGDYKCTVCGGWFYAY